MSKPVEREQSAAWAVHKLEESKATLNKLLSLQQDAHVKKSRELIVRAEAAEAKLTAVREWAETDPQDKHGAAWDARYEVKAIIDKGEE